MKTQLILYFYNILNIIIEVLLNNQGFCILTFFNYHLNNKYKTNLCGKQSVSNPRPVVCIL